MYGWMKLKKLDLVKMKKRGEAHTTLIFCVYCWMIEKAKKMTG